MGECIGIGGQNTGAVAVYPMWLDIILNERLQRNNFNDAIFKVAQGMHISRPRQRQTNTLFTHDDL